LEPAGGGREGQVACLDSSENEVAGSTVICERGGKPLLLEGLDAYRTVLSTQREKPENWKNWALGVDFPRRLCLGSFMLGYKCGRNPWRDIASDFLRRMYSPKRTHYRKTRTSTLRNFETTGKLLTNDFVKSGGEGREGDRTAVGCKQGLQAAASSNVHNEMFIGLSPFAPRGPRREREQMPWGIGVRMSRWTVFP